MNMRYYLFLIALLMSKMAWAVSDNIKVMCVDDYLAYCSEFELDTPELTTCMKNAADKLSDGCRVALKGEGYSKEELSPTKEEMSPTQEPSPTADIPPEQQDNQKVLKVEQETSQPKAAKKKNLAKSIDKSKKAGAIKTTQIKQIPKKDYTKTKTSMMTYPKWLEIPRSTGNTLSVYGAY